MELRRPAGCEGARVSQDRLWLEVVRPRGLSGMDVWVAKGRDGEVVVQPPVGELIVIQGRTDAAALLEGVASAVGGINRVAGAETIALNCSPDVEALLPLWLVAGETADGGDSLADEDLDLLDDSLSWAPYSAEHIVRVNGAPWGAVQADRPGQPAGCVFAPLRPGGWLDDWFSKIYGSFSFTETASRTSGVSTSALGLITPSVLAAVDKFDEEKAVIRVRLARDAEGDLRAWIGGGEMARQLRASWRLGPGDADFLEWGFLQLAKSRGQSIDLVGMDVGADDDEGLGIGLTRTAEWTFESDLPSDLIRRAVEGVPDRRPGIPWSP